MKPFAESCEQNKTPILEVLNQYLPQQKRLLEIGSGTGQHAIFFARQFPNLEWVPSDCKENLDGIKAWLAEFPAPNLRHPVCLDVDRGVWPKEKFDSVFSANTTHIMSSKSVENMLKGIGRILTTGGFFCLYGPFNFHGGYTSESNKKFDEWLKLRDPRSGIRDFESLNNLAKSNNLIFLAKHQMPANNYMLVWQKT